MLIDKTYFVGEINIPNVGNPVVDAMLQPFIDKYEKEYLLKVLGTETYDLLETAVADLGSGGLLADLPEPWLSLVLGGLYQDTQLKAYRWRGLVDKSIETMPQSPIANYVYYWFMRNVATQTTSMGEKKTTTENAVDTTAAVKVSRAWNEMSRWTEQLNHFFRTNPVEYPLWKPTYSVVSGGGYFLGGSTFGKINEFDL